MALRNIWSQVQNQFQVGSIDAGVIELNDVPISGGGGGSVGTLSQVLATGSNGGNNSITNLNTVQMNGSLQLTNNSINTVQLNTGTNSWQLVSSNGEFYIQNYLNSSLHSSSFQIDNDGNVLIGNSETTTPYLYVMGGLGPARVYDTLYNPIPTNPTSGVVFNQNIAVPLMNSSSAVVNNSNISSHIVLLKTFPVNNYSGASHYVLTINSITALLSNFESSSFYLDFALISNRNGNVSTVTQSDINKNFSIPRFTQSNYTQNTNFTISDIQIEFFDNSGINNLMLVCYSFGLSASNVFNVSSMNMNVRCDNLGTYTDLPDITT